LKCWKLVILRGHTLKWSRAPNIDFSPPPERCRYLAHVTSWGYAFFSTSAIKGVSHSFLVRLGSFNYRWESTSLASHRESIWYCLALLSWLNIVSPSVFIQFAWFNLQMKSMLSLGTIYKYLALFVYWSKQSK
jgi:hypothetical protein